MDNSIQIALVQTPLLWEDPAGNRMVLERKIAEVAQQVDLFVLPEMFTTGFTMNPKNLDAKEGVITVAWMQGLAKKNLAAITGSIVFFENGKLFNRLFFVYPDGNYITYDKKHTFTLAGEDKVYTAGQERVLIPYKGFSICPLICYDLRFPVWARNTDNYDILLYVANWPKPRIKAWDALLKARAIENMSYVVGVNRIGDDAEGHEYPGHSAVYDVYGHSMVHSVAEEVLVVRLEKGALEAARRKLRFLEDRDSFTFT